MPPVEATKVARVDGRVRNGLLLASSALMAVTLYLVYFWVPTEENLGVSQRIFYFHVPLAMLGIAGIAVVAVASVGYLATRRQHWDDVAYAAAEVGLLFASLALITGSMWAKPVWGVWWTWSAKLTLTLILWFIYVAYLMVRAYAPKGSQGARYGAVVALVGVVASALNYAATTIWREAHPALNLGPLATAENAIGSSQISDAFMVAIITFTVFYAFLVVQRYSLRRAESALDDLYKDAF